jgi:hypothetical protein
MTEEQDQDQKFPDEVVLFNKNDVELPQSVAAAPDKTQAILLMRACGFSPTEMGKWFGITPNAIHNAIRRADPEGLIRYNHSLARQLAVIAMTKKRMEVIGHLTTDKMREASARDLAQCLHVLSTHIDRLSADSKREEKDSTALMKMIQARMSGPAQVGDGSAEGETEEDDDARE